MACLKHPSCVPSTSRAGSSCSGRGQISTTSSRSPLMTSKASMLQVTVDSSASVQLQNYSKAKEDFWRAQALHAVSPQRKGLSKVKLVIPLGPTGTRFCCVSGGRFAGTLVVLATSYHGACPPADGHAGSARSAGHCLPAAGTFWDLRCNCGCSARARQPQECPTPSCWWRSPTCSLHRKCQKHAGSL